MNVTIGSSTIECVCVCVRSAGVPMAGEQQASKIQLYSCSNSEAHEVAAIATTEGELILQRDALNQCNAELPVKIPFACFSLPSRSASRLRYWSQQPHYMMRRPAFFKHQIF